MKSYRDLEIYQSSKRLAIEIHGITMKLPKHELFEEGSQIRRSSKAITALIVEGYCRRTYKNDYIKYLIHAHAECDETMVHLEFLYETKSLANDKLFKELLRSYTTLSKQISTFISWVEKQK
jgi:four helix bundle protein